MTVETAVLDQITPTPAEQEALAKATESLLAAATSGLADLELSGTPSIQGSIAKDTYLTGSMDVDLFLLLDPATPEEELKRAAETLGPRLLDDARRKYAQHPYIVGTWNGLTVDLVPAYAVPEAGDRMSAVDRTPFHTAWVNERLDDTLRQQVRLAKAWCKGCELYGAETFQAAFSGYLLEVLLVHFGGFPAFLDWLATGARPRRISLGDDQVEEKAPLVVVDPVDRTRNCAAAVSEETLARAEVAAASYLQSPSESFFFPAPPRIEDADVLRGALAEQDAAWIGLPLQPATDRLDIVLPQFKRFARSMADALTEAGFHCQDVDVTLYEEDGEERVGIQWRTQDTTLPETYQHKGPNADQGPNADRFEKKWSEHPDALGDVETDDDGRLQVTLRNRHRTPAAWLSARLARGDHPKHVRTALADDDTVLDDPADAPAPWAPSVADFVLGRKPWER